MGWIYSKCKFKLEDLSFHSILPTHGPLNNWNPLWIRKICAIRQMHRLSMFLLAMGTSLAPDQHHHHCRLAALLFASLNKKLRLAPVFAPRHKIQQKKKIKMDGADKLFRLTATEELLMSWHSGHVCPAQTADTNARRWVHREKNVLFKQPKYHAFTLNFGLEPHSLFKNAVNLRYIQK